MDENTRTATRRMQRTRTDDERKAAARIEYEEYKAMCVRLDREEVERQEVEDARAQWLGYQSEHDFVERCGVTLKRHPILPRHMVRHARFIYLGADR